MSAGGSTKVIIVSLCANFGIALSKLGAALFTGSAALLAEAVHSFSDCGNQMLLLYGQHVGKKPPTKKYPLGRAKETFFWSFVVAVLLFTMGGIFSMLEGIHKIKEPQPLQHPLVGILILLVACVLEGYSCRACLKEIKLINRFGSLWGWIRGTTSSDLLVILLEDLAAMAGLTIALLCLTIAWISGAPVWDGIGSAAIGVLLIGVAAVLAREVKSLIVGEAPSFDYHGAVEKILPEIMPEGKLLRFIALQRGIGAVLVAYKLHPGQNVTNLQEAIDLVNKLEARVKQEFPEIMWQFAEMDDHA